MNICGDHGVAAEGSIDFFPIVVLSVSAACWSDQAYAEQKCPRLKHHILRCWTEQIAQATVQLDNAPARSELADLSRSRVRSDYGELSEFFRPRAPRQASAAQNLDGERLKGSLLHARYQTTSTQPLSQERGPRRTPPPLWKTAFTKVDCTHADFLRFVAAMRDID